MSGASLNSPLRWYQREAARAILDSVLRGRGLSFSVEMSRQGGKNELSARVELYLLLAYLNESVTSIKAAPTFDPQCLISRDRLWDRLRDARLLRWAVREGANKVRLGRARQLFLSAERGSSIVGHTASLLLEIDEAQDVDIEKFDKELQPMTASTGATTVFYGTAWDDANLLERAKHTHLAAERRDGVRRHFEYDWQDVAGVIPDYGKHVAKERERLGPEHPLFLTQYCLRTLPGAGRLLGTNQLALLQGAHRALEAPIAGETYVAGLDVGGEDANGFADRSPERVFDHDATVLTIARVLPVETEAGEHAIEVVRHYAWSGAPHTALHASLVALVKEWRVRRLAVDATGIGEPVAAFLAAALGKNRVQARKLTAESKSSLGYGLLEAINTGRLRLYAGAESELVECRRQLERCRAAYRANQSLSFHVDASDGHDDYVVSLALAVAAAGAAPLNRAARGRQPADGAEA
jgi:Terminase RNaseH-like domain